MYSYTYIKLGLRNVYKKKTSVTLLSLAKNILRVRNVLQNKYGALLIMRFSRVPLMHFIGLTRHYCEVDIIHFTSRLNARVLALRASRKVLNFHK